MIPLSLTNKEIVIANGVQGQTIEKVYFTGNDLILKLLNGQTWVFHSTVDGNGNSFIEFNYSRHETHEA